MVILGTNYLIWIDTETPITAERGNPLHYRPVVCGVGNGTNMSVEEITIRNKDDKGWSHSRPGYGSWGLSLDGHAVGVRNSEKEKKANFNTLNQLMINKTMFWAKMADLDNTIVDEGVVWISSFTKSANNNELFTFDCNFVGVGKPISETSLFTTVLATDDTGTEVLQDGNNNLIDVKSELSFSEGVSIPNAPETWNDNSTWGG